MALGHDFPDCTGRWRVRTIGDKACWRCDVCAAVGYMTIANHEAAVLENLLGRELDQLTSEGRRILEADGTVP